MDRFIRDKRSCVVNWKLAIHLAFGLETGGMRTVVSALVRQSMLT